MLINCICKGIDGLHAKVVQLCSDLDKVPSCIVLAYKWTLLGLAQSEIGSPDLPQNLIPEIVGFQDEHFNALFISIDGYFVSILFLY